MINGLIFTPVQILSLHSPYQDAREQMSFIYFLYIFQIKFLFHTKKFMNATFSTLKKLN